MQERHCAFFFQSPSCFRFIEHCCVEAGAPWVAVARAATRMEGQCLTAGAPPTCSNRRSQSQQCEQLARFAMHRVLSSHIAMHGVRARVRECGRCACMCMAAPHMMSMVSTSSHVRDHATHATWLSRAHARAPRSVRTSTLHAVGGCMFLAEPAMFLLTWCFCCSGQCFCFVFARRASVFACVWSQI